MTLTNPGSTHYKQTPIGRGQVSHTVAATASSTTTEEIPFGWFAGGAVILPGGSPIGTLTFYGSDLPAAGAYPGTYGACQDGAGNAVTLSVSAGNAYPLPVSLFGYGYIKIVVDVAGTLVLSLKG